MSLRTRNSEYSWSYGVLKFPRSEVRSEIYGGRFGSEGDCGVMIGPEGDLRREI
jgi:hypothetical protein